MEPQKILLNLLLTSAVIYLLARSNLIAGVVIGGVYSAFVVASLMGLLNIAARTTLVMLRVPVVLLTLWLTTVALNTLILLFIGQFMDSDQFASGGPMGAFLGALIISVAQSVMHKIFS